MQTTLSAFNFLFGMLLDEGHHLNIMHILLCPKLKDLFLRFGKSPLADLRSHVHKCWKVTFQIYSAYGVMCPASSTAVLALSILHCIIAFSLNLRSEVYFFTNLRSQYADNPFSI